MSWFIKKSYAHRRADDGNSTQIWQKSRRQRLDEVGEILPQELGPRPLCGACWKDLREMQIRLLFLPPELAVWPWARYSISLSLREIEITNNTSFARPLWWLRNIYNKDQALCPALGRYWRNSSSEESWAFDAYKWEKRKMKGQGEQWSIKCSLDMNLSLPCFSWNGQVRSQPVKYVFAPGGLFVTFQKQ